MARKCKSCFNCFDGICSNVFYGQDCNTIVAAKVNEYECYIPIPSFLKRKRYRGRLSSGVANG